MILVFAGAGASRAVSAEKYPTTVEFVESIPREIASTSLFQAALQFLREQKAALSTDGNDVVIDVEEILWAVDRIAMFASSLGETDDLAGWMHSKGMFSVDFKAAGVAPQNFERVLESMTYRAKQVRDGLNNHVHDVYDAKPSALELERTWLPALRGILEIDDSVQIFTTNYDLVIEDALLHLEPDWHVSTGRDDGHLRFLRTEAWEPRERGAPHANKRLLTKLHGSIDWGFDKKGRIQTGNTELGRLDRQLIAYPGYKGQPIEPPLSLFYEHFRWAIAEADAVVFIGYAFRDEPLNRIIERGITTEKVLLIDPSTPNVPVSRQHQVHLRSGFDESAVGSMLEYLRLDGPELALEARHRALIETGTTSDNLEWGDD